MSSPRHERGYLLTLNDPRYRSGSQPPVTPTAHFTTDIIERGGGGWGTGGMTDEAIDVGRLLRRVGGNPRVFEQVVRLTIEAAPGMMAEVRAAATRRDRAALGRALHSLRGAVGLVAGERLGNLVAELQTIAHDTSFDAVDEMCGALENALPRCLATLERFVSGRG